MNCPDCGTKLSYGAKSCSCGWGAKKRAEPSGFRAPNALVNCEAQGCRQMALVKMPDQSNLCEFHVAQWWTHNYRAVKHRVTENQLCNEIRAAYAKSVGFQRKHGKREPGSDDELDALAEKLADRMAA